MLFFCQKKGLFSLRCLQHFLAADGFLQLILFKKSGYFSPKMSLKPSLWAVIMLRGAPYKVAYHWQPVGGKEAKTVWLSRSLLSDEVKNLSILLSALQNDEHLLDLALTLLGFSFPEVLGDAEGSYWHLSVQMSAKKTFFFNHYLFLIQSCVQSHITPNVPFVLHLIRKKRAPLVPYIKCNMHSLNTRK